MSRLRINAFSVSVDGYGAGPRQSLENPLGEGGEALHEWLFPTDMAQRTIFGGESGTTGIDNDFAVAGFENIGAWILGRNMFAHSRGPWTDDGWTGWWGDEPPYHCDTYVLTHHPRPPLEMAGGTTFHFVTDGIEAALERARRSAAGKDVRLGGGASLVRQYFQAQLVDEAHFAFSPVLLGSGEALFPGLDLPALGYKVGRAVATSAAQHVVITRA